MAEQPEAKREEEEQEVREVCCCPVCGGVHWAPWGPMKMKHMMRRGMWPMGGMGMGPMAGMGMGPMGAWPMAGMGMGPMWWAWRSRMAYMGTIASILGFAIGYMAGSRKGWWHAQGPQAYGKACK